VDIDDPLETEGLPKWIGFSALTAALIVVGGIAYMKNAQNEDQIADKAFTSEEFETSASTRNGLEDALTIVPEKRKLKTEGSTNNPFQETTTSQSTTDSIVNLYKESSEVAPPAEVIPRESAPEDPDDWFNEKSPGGNVASQSNQPNGSQRVTASFDYDEPSVKNHVERPVDRYSSEEQMMQNALLGNQEEKSDTIASRLSSHRAASYAIPTGSRDSMLSRGKTLPCVLETAVQTDLPGLTRCIVARAVFSDNGERLLIPRGTVATGEYQGGIKRGVNRIFVIWTRLRSPDGVITELAAPGVGPLGASGVHAKLNNHFWARFGSSMLLSIVGGLSATEDNDEGSTYGASAQALSRTAEIALEESIGIKTTGSVPIGSLINIMVAEDINFDLVPRNGR